MYWQLIQSLGQFNIKGNIFPEFVISTGQFINVDTTMMINPFDWMDYWLYQSDQCLMQYLFEVSPTLYSQNTSGSL
jgi:hypothetical protein